MFGFVGSIRILFHFNAPVCQSYCTLEESEMMSMAWFWGQHHLLLAPRARPLPLPLQLQNVNKKENFGLDCNVIPGQKLSMSVCLFVCLSVYLSSMWTVCLFLVNVRYKKIIFCIFIACIPYLLLLVVIEFLLESDLSCFTIIYSCFNMFYAKTEWNA